MHGDDSGLLVFTFACVVDRAHGRATTSDARTTTLVVWFGSQRADRVTSRIPALQRIDAASTCPVETRRRRLRASGTELRHTPGRRNGCASAPRPVPMDSGSRCAA